MSQFGFVYILQNEYMPGLIKIGCTERSPQQRAEELSKHTGVPAPFKVLCFAEFDSFQQVEHQMHEWCKNYRVNNGREFFKDCLTWAVQLLWFNPGRLTFTDGTLDTDGNSELIPMVCEEHQLGLDYLRNPWGNNEEEDAKQARHVRYANGDFEPKLPNRAEPDSSTTGFDAYLEAHESVRPDEPEEPEEIPMPEVLPWEASGTAPPKGFDPPALRVVGGTAE